MLVDTPQLIRDLPYMELEQVTVRDVLSRLEQRMNIVSPPLLSCVCVCVFHPSLEQRTNTVSPPLELCVCVFHPSLEQRMNTVSPPLELHKCLIVS